MNLIVFQRDKDQRTITFAENSISLKCLESNLSLYYIKVFIAPVNNSGIFR